LYKFALIAGQRERIEREASAVILSGLPFLCARIEQLRPLLFSPGPPCLNDVAVIAANGERPQLGKASGSNGRGFSFLAVTGATPDA
jgi:hypothetical protein